MYCTSYSVCYTVYKYYLVGNVILYTYIKPGHMRATYLGAVPEMSERVVKVLVKRISPDAKMPSQGHPGDAAFDLCSVIDYELKPGERAAIPTGLVLEIPQGFEGQVRPRSGLALKSGVTVLNTPGTIDSGYRGEVKTIMINLGQESFMIEKGMRISQLAIRPVPDVQLVEVEELSESARGEGGFGSTGR
jgi:dUTP pyrophosphatase